MDYRYRNALASEVGRTISTAPPRDQRPAVITNTKQQVVKQPPPPPQPRVFSPPLNQPPAPPQPRVAQRRHRSSDADDDTLRSPCPNIAITRSRSTSSCSNTSSSSNDRKRKTRTQRKKHRVEMPKSGSEGKGEPPRNVSHGSTSPPHPQTHLESNLRAALESLQPTKEDVARRRLALQDLAACLGQLKVLAQLYGSSRTGLALPWSDIDVFACELPPDMSSLSSRGGGAEYGGRMTVEGGVGTPVSPSSNGTGSASPVVPLVSSSMLSMSRRERESYVGVKLNKILRALRSRNSPFTSITPIRHARVPIVKCKHARTGVEVDCSLSADGLATSDYLNAQLGLEGMHLARGLIVLVKALLEKSGFNDPSVGGLGSFATSLMVIWYLKSEVPHYPRPQANSIAVLFIGFLQYYGTTFDWRRTGVDVLRLRLLNKPLTTEFMVMNPIDPSQNAAKACTSFPRIAVLFQQTANALLPLQNPAVAPQAVDQQLRSIFGRQLERRIDSTRRGIERAQDPIRQMTALATSDDASTQWDGFGLFRGMWI